MEAERGGRAMNTCASEIGSLEKGRQIKLSIMLNLLFNIIVK
jgi:hypothetical protein